MHDAVLVRQADESQLLQVKHLILHFAKHIGLRVNYYKSILVPINVSPDKIHRLVTILGCQQGSFPFKYLGLPLSLSKPRIEDFPLLSRRLRGGFWVFHYALL